MDSSGYGTEYQHLHQPALIVGGCFAAVAVLTSIYLILQHLRSYTNPAEQKWVVAVIFMVPVYATESVSFYYIIVELKIFFGMRHSEKLL